MITTDNSLKYCVFEGSTFGGKATQLIRLTEAGFQVPKFKLIPAEFLDHILLKAENNHIDLIDKYEFSTDQEEAILAQIGEAKYFSVRSSAVGEDGKEHSFAGQFDTFLYVPKDEIPAKIKAVWKSTFSDRIAFYRKQNNIETPLRMAVVIQEMIDADTSGVMFGINPVTQDPDEMLISAVYGIGEGLVSGELDADNYFFKDGKLDRSDIAKKSHFLCQSEENSGTMMMTVEEKLINIPALDDAQLARLFEKLQKLNDFYNHPQDVEWAIEDDQVYILQSRPITNLKAPKSGTRIIWDNSNIIESYPGVTTPLTFSFIREMYKVVYVQFSSLLGIENKVLEANMDVYENMLGLLRGRVYYNLRSWYRALALLPGYKLNAGFMETMMGVKERFDLEEEYQGSKTRARIRIIRTIFKMIGTFRSLPRKRDEFLSFLNKTISEYKSMDFVNSDPETLMKHYKTFETVLTKKWDPPLINDFFAMIYFGTFQKLIVKWIGDEHPHLHNDLLASSNDIISTQPMIQSLRMAQDISKNEDLITLFDQEPEKVWKDLEMGNNPEMFQRIQKYLDLFGERCLGELKLETISYNQAPEKFIKILQSYLKNPSSLSALDHSRSDELKKKAQQIVQDKLKGKFFKKRIFRYFTRKTRDLVSNRENLRFERTRGFGIVREIFSAMGVQFQERNLIHHHRDIFYLTKKEIFDFIKGTSIISDFKETIELRKREYETYYKDEYVPERVVTYGSVNEDLVFEAPPLEAEDGDITGIACCPGIVRSEVCVVHSPDQIDDLKGRIMVTSSTDPGWVSLFPTASAILVERGSLLSHSAIVARELGIPCIVSITGLLQKLKTGDVLEMDGSTGVIKIVDDGA